MVSDEEALLDLLGELRARDYRFTCVTPATHERYLAKPAGDDRLLREVFGWNREFAPDQLPHELLALLRRADCVEAVGSALRSRIRVASLGDHLFVHSAFPTQAADAVFFGPDTYRFARFIEARMPSNPRWIVDMGAGSGAGGIVAAAHAPGARLRLIDVNPAAARLASVNARFAGCPADVVVADRVPGGCDLLVANPPYMIDGSRRTYRDGGAMLGGQVACEWVRQALASLAPGGVMLLYTGAAFAGGRAPLVEAVAAMCREAPAELTVEEIDPDVFGEELDGEAYATVERIAALGIRIATAA